MLTRDSSARNCIADLIDVSWCCDVERVKRVWSDFHQRYFSWTISVNGDVVNAFLFVTVVNLNVIARRAASLRPRYRQSCMRWIQCWTRSLNVWRCNTIIQQWLQRNQTKPVQQILQMFSLKVKTCYWLSFKMTSQVNSSCRIQTNHNAVLLPKM